MTRLPPDEFAAFVGIDWADATHDICLPAVGAANREYSVLAHQPDTLDAWVSTLRQRFKGDSIALCRERNKGPLVSALRKYAFLVLFPLHPLPLARSREAFTPSHAKDAPTDAELPLALRLQPREQRQPLQPQSPAMRALAPLVAHRRRVVGDNVRITPRLPSPLPNACPHVRPWLPEKATALCCDFLAPWPPLTAAHLARRSPLERCFHAQHVRYAAIIAQRLHALKSARPLPTAAGGITPQARLVQALVAPRRVPLQAIEAFDQASAHRAQSHPAFPLFDALPGAGAVCAPRLRVAFGEPRNRYASAEALQKYAGIAPVTERSGKTPWGHWPLQCPQCLRQTFVAWAAASTRHSFWARASSQQQRDKGTSHQAAVRALACKWSRLLCRWWQTRTPYNEAGYLTALPQRGAPLIPHRAHLSCTRSGELGIIFSPSTR